MASDKCRGTSFTNALKLFSVARSAFLRIDLSALTGIAMSRREAGTARWYGKVSLKIATISDYSAETDIHLHNRDRVNEEIAERLSVLNIMLERGGGDYGAKLTDIADRG